MNKTFFLDIFNKILRIGDKDIFIIFDIKGEIWLSFKSLLSSLEYSSYTKQLTKLNIDKNFIKYYKDIKKVPYFSGVPLNFQNNTKFINESGLYQLLSHSTKPIAKLFMDKYFTEIMPQIRKTGKYEVNKEEMTKIKKLSQKIDLYKEELKHHEKFKFEKSDNGYFYISENITINKGKEIKCLKVGYCKDIEKRMKVYKVGHYKYKLLSYIPIVLDGKQLEDCVKSKMKMHLKKIGSDTLCFTSLQNLKKEILSCADFIKEHICYCLICKKKYKLINIDKHLCNKTDKLHFL
jgi:prophage antirepressor-like protein